jgi:hypothetical protein
MTEGSSSYHKVVLSLEFWRWGAFLINGKPASSAALSPVGKAVRWAWAPTRAAHSYVLCENEGR